MHGAPERVAQHHRKDISQTVCDDRLRQKAFLFINLADARLSKETRDYRLQPAMIIDMMRTPPGKFKSAP